jgi:hypothetical protein
MLESEEHRIVLIIMSLHILQNVFRHLITFLLLMFAVSVHGSLDPAKVLGPETCGGCHKLEFDKWKSTRHFMLLDTLYKNPMAQGIARKMGEKLIKVDSICMDCHFTPRQMSGRLTATAGVSCESCHGAARDWITIHNDYGGKGVTKETETAAHKKQRYERSAQAGMFLPEQIYLLAGNCFGCHTVQNEKLVNTGGHPAGSSFDLAARVNEIRHNFLRSGRNVNAPITPERKRVMYVVGWALELEYGLRGAALSREEGTFVKGMESRVRSALSELRALQAEIAIPEIEQIIGAAQGLGIKPNNEIELNHAADKVKAAGKSFVEKHDGTKLAAVDRLITESSAGPSVQADSSNTDSGKAGSANSPGSIKLQSKFKTIGPGCSCHATQNDWWTKDKHYSSAGPFWDENPKNLKIAKLFGISSKDMKTGKAACMDCHGTVVTGKESREVADGVSCESCHGPAGEYLKVHNQGGKWNPKAFDAGMRKLEDHTIKAEVCTSCHYITNQKLISTGHPSNADFDYVQAMEKIKHWKTQNDPQSMRSAFSKKVAERGPVPAAIPITSVPEVEEPPSEVAEKKTTSKKQSVRAQVVTVGVKQSHIRPLSKFRTIGPKNCGGCHVDQNSWWSGDKHNSSAEPFWNDNSVNVAIAAAYGITPAEMKNGQNICMDCHGTVESGKESREVADGVSCESCHGPAGDYHKVHNAGNRFNSQAYQAGMRKLKDLNVRAELCTGCHLITDVRLLASGHPSSSGFDYIQGMNKIKHWKAANDSGALKAAFASAISKRGPVPDVTPVASIRRTTAQENRPVTPLKTPRPRPAGPALPEMELKSIDLPPFPEIDESASVEDLLLLIQERLRLLQEKVRSEK